ncbi:MAG: tetratricopeptide repeat protein [Bilophila sp.]
MSNDLTKARQQLSQIRTYLRMGKPLPAIQALYSTTLIVLKNPLMKSEKDEFAIMLEDAVYCIMADPEVKRLFPLNIIYTPGNERKLFDDVRMLLETVDSSIRDAAQDTLRMMTERRGNLFASGEEHLKNKELPQARADFVALSKEFKDDSAMLGEIGELYLKYGEYDDAIEYLEAALKLNPELAHLYNHIGMALRKVKNFATAEKYYLRASNYLGRDPNLFFNLGRLYLDWEQWDKAVRASAAAIKLQPDFVEAQRLKEYAETKLHNSTKGRLG